LPNSKPVPPLSDTFAKRHFAAGPYPKRDVSHLSVWPEEDDSTSLVARPVLPPQFRSAVTTCLNSFRPWLGGIITWPNPKDGLDFALRHAQTEFHAGIGVNAMRGTAKRKPAEVNCCANGRRHRD